MRKFNVLSIPVCGVCLVAIANNDYTGVTDAEEKAIKEGISRLSMSNTQVVADGESLGFCRYNCMCCDALAGERFRVNLLSERKGK